jgi:hypothetical protein
LIVALASSTLLNLLVAKLYTVTHGGYSYSKSFLQTVVLVGITVTLIMVIIGSDIARAFALVGAMSIVRFRTPVKDSRDLVFIFAAIAVGMACGTQFHVFAGIFVIFLAVLLLGFHYGGFGELAHKGYVLKVRINGSDKDRLAELSVERGRDRGRDLRGRTEEGRCLQGVARPPSHRGPALLGQRPGGRRQCECLTAPSRGLPVATPTATVGARAGRTYGPAKPIRRRRDPAQGRGPAGLQRLPRTRRQATRAGRLTPDQGAQPDTGRLRGQADFVQMGETRRVLSGQGLAGHSGPDGPGRSREEPGRRPKHQLRSCRCLNDLRERTE